MNFFEIDGWLEQELFEEEQELQKQFEKDNFVPEDKDPCMDFDEDDIEVGPFGWG